MHYKRLIGAGLLIIGVVAIVYSIYAMHRIKEAKRESETLSSLFSGAPIEDSASSVVQHEVSKYGFKVMVLLFGGIVLVLAGAAVTIFPRK